MSDLQGPSGPRPGNPAGWYPDPLDPSRPRWWDPATGWMPPLEAAAGPRGHLRDRIIVAAPVPVVSLLLTALAPAYFLPMLRSALGIILLAVTFGLAAAAFFFFPRRDPVGRRSPVGFLLLLLQLPGIVVILFGPALLQITNGCGGWTVTC